MHPMNGTKIILLLVLLLSPIVQLDYLGMKIDKNNRTHIMTSAIMHSMDERFHQHCIVYIDMDGCMGGWMADWHSLLITDCCPSIVLLLFLAICCCCCQQSMLFGGGKLFFYLRSFTSSTSIIYFIQFYLKSQFKHILFRYKVHGKAFGGA